MVGLGAGGLSGLPLRARATEVTRYLHQKSDGGRPIIGAGGIYSAANAREKLAAGATLIQLYTSFLYEGPALVSRINRSLARGLLAPHEGGPLVEAEEQRAKVKLDYACQATGCASPTFFDGEKNDKKCVIQPVRSKMKI